MRDVKMISTVKPLHSKSSNPEQFHMKKHVNIGLWKKRVVLT